jgi:hypothetical protein
VTKGDRLVFQDDEGGPVYGRIVNIANGYADIVSFYMGRDAKIKQRKHKIKDTGYTNFRTLGRDAELEHKQLMLANAKRAS